MDKEEIVGAISQGRIDGNYCEAYSCTDLMKGIRADMSEDLWFRSDTLKLAWLAGFVVGFYGSYEAHEVPQEGVRALDAATTFVINWEQPAVINDEDYEVSKDDLRAILEKV
jgi:hypothetical protein